MPDGQLWRDFAKSRNAACDPVAAVRKLGYSGHYAEYNHKARPDGISVASVRLRKYRSLGGERRAKSFDTGHYRCSERGPFDLRGGNRRRAVHTFERASCDFWCSKARCHFRSLGGYAMRSLHQQAKGGLSPDRNLRLQTPESRIQFPKDILCLKSIVHASSQRKQAPTRRCMSGLIPTSLLVPCTI